MLNDLDPAETLRTSVVVCVKGVGFDIFMLKENVKIEV
jgi:hypothetical protein